jgi:hypothetical protein
MAPDEFSMSLHDARLRGYSSADDGDVIVSILQWNQSLVELRFREVVLLKNLVGDGDLEKLVECHESDELREARERLSNVRYPEPASAPFRHFRLLDDSNYAVLDIVCQEVIRMS